METFKYSLDQSSKKFLCPNCNKKTFVKYIETETGNFLTDQFGRCDRANSCNYHKVPPKGTKGYLIDFLLLKRISDKAYRLTDVNGIINIIPNSQILEQSKNDCWITEWFLKSSSIQYLANQSKYFNTDKISLINVVTATTLPSPVPPTFHSLKLLNEMYFENPKADNLTKFLKTKFTECEIFEAMQDYFITGTKHFWSNATVFWQIDKNENIRGGKDYGL